MWYAVRDIALDHPDVGDPLAAMMKAFAGGAGGQAMQGMARSLGAAARIVPEIDATLETMITRMTGLLLIELLAFNTFAWAEQLLSDGELFERGVEAARVVSFIRADEEPHVGYLRATLTEMRARTFVTVDGAELAGTDVINRYWDYSLRQMFGLGGKRGERREMILALLDQALDGHPRRRQILHSFHDLETPDPVVAEAAVGAPGPAYR